MVIKKCVSRSLVCGLVSNLAFYQPAYALLPVFDSTNWFESMTQTTQQLKQYETELDQYKNMQENSKTLSIFNWDKTNTTMTNLLGSIDTLKYYKEQTGGLEAYLSRYQTQEHYQASPCLNGSTCTEADMQTLRQQEVAGSEAQKRANDAMLRGVDKQQAAMLEDARQLEKMTKQAQDSKGQMEAIQAANQLASAETNQLLQIRGLLVAEQTAAATRAAALADKEAIQAAGDERFRAGTFKKSSGKTW